MFAVSCVSLTIFPVYSSRMTIPFSFLDIFFLRIFMVLLPLCCVLLKDILLFYMNPVKLCVSVCFQWSTWGYFSILGIWAAFQFMSICLLFQLTQNPSTKFFQSVPIHQVSPVRVIKKLYTEVRFVQEYCLPLPAPFLGLEI